MMRLSQTSMPERFARLTALALLVILIIALPLLVSLFGGFTAPPPTPTSTLPTALAFASPTVPLPTNTLPPPDVTETPTLAPLPSSTDGCPIPSTPEPLWVNPVSSPTNLLTQKIAVSLGHGREISITGEAGTITQQGEFSAAQPVEIEIPLVPNTSNHLQVIGKVEYASGCFYTLQTASDRVGTPLVIVQTSESTPPTLIPPTVQVPPTAGISPTPPPPGSVYLNPFSQVFALNQDNPGPTDQLWLYEGPADTSFQVAGQQGTFTHLVSQDSTLNFWTLNDNLLPTPSPEPVFDHRFAGRPVEFVSDKIFGCEGQYPGTLLLGQCAEFVGAVNGEIIQSVQFQSSVLYQVRISGKIYWVSSNVLKTEPS